MPFQRASCRQATGYFAAAASRVAILIATFQTQSLQSAPVEPSSASGAQSSSPSSADDGKLSGNPGHALAVRWCGNCHLAPEPGDLPRERWPYIVKWMGNYLGYPNTDDDVKKLIYPTLVATKPFITRDELRLIEEYYVNNAPEQIAPAFPRDKALPLTTTFQAAPWPRSPQAITISMVAIDPPRRRLYVGTLDDSSLRLFGDHGRLLTRINCDNNQPAEVRPTKDGFDLALFGDLGVDLRHGTVQKIHGTGDTPGPLSAARTVTGFHRTSGAAWGDLDGDGHEDVALAGFGDYADGALSWFQIRPGEEPIRRDLRIGSGALDAVIDDVDADGDLDVLSLVAQGHQEMLWFENDGKGRFQSHLLWKERPILGYNSFQWTDFDGDGKKDLIVASGNNMEMADPPLKPVHGVYVYLQTGPMQFEKKHFLRLDGAMKALAGDYDNDGDSDVVAISAYPDWRSNSPVAFALFTNEGNGKFTPSTIPAPLSGQPITMDAGDLDGDGDLDVVLGGASWKPLLPEPLQSQAVDHIAKVPAVVMLWNQTKSPAPPQVGTAAEPSR